MRVGIGYDIHRLKESRELILGGVKIPYELGLEGHSDADVLLHAICDALLGALALGDIGQHFPNTDMQYKNISSLILLEKVNLLIYNRGFITNNVDAVIVAEKPKLAPFIPEMRSNIARILGIDIDSVSVKATTAEKLGSIGNGKGISAQAVVTIKPR
ncbi:MAG: 2-C-methyl-D-erythritol 2,4-cyclodiphosphate synthase [Candidatus Poribacteria bacterium]